MNDFVIVTDSSCDLPNDLVQKLELHVVPLAFIMGDKTYWNYPDNREMSPEDFYGRQKQGQMATTTAVNVGQATDVLEPILKQGKDLLVLAFSSGLSTTCNSFQIAATELGAQYPDRKVFVVDTLLPLWSRGCWWPRPPSCVSRERAWKRFGTGWRTTNSASATGSLSTICFS